MARRKAPSYVGKKRELNARLRRIEGQLAGIRSMMENERDCLDIVQQIEALTAASREVSIMLLETHVRELVRNAVQNGDGDAAMKELGRTLRRILKRER